MGQNKKKSLVEAPIRIIIIDESVAIKAPVVGHAARADAVLPFARKLTDVAMGNGICRAEAQGKQVMC